MSPVRGLLTQLAWPLGPILGPALQHLTQNDVVHLKLRVKISWPQTGASELI